MRIKDFKKKDSENKNVSGNLLDVTIEDITHTERNKDGNILIKTTIKLVDKFGDRILLEVWELSKQIDSKFKVGNRIKLSHIYSYYDTFYRSYILKMNKKSGIFLMNGKTSIVSYKPILEGINQGIVIDSVILEEFRDLKNKFDILMVKLLGD